MIQARFPEAPILKRPIGDSLNRFNPQAADLQSPFATLSNQSSPLQIRQMFGNRLLTHVEGFAQLTDCRRTVGQPSEYLSSGRIAQGRKCGAEGVIIFHNHMVVYKFDKHRRKRKTGAREAFRKEPNRAGLPIFNTMYRNRYRNRPCIWLAPAMLTVCALALSPGALPNNSYRLAAQDSPPPTSPTGSLVELSAAEIAAIDFADRDESARSAGETVKPGARDLEAALHHSLAYYLELPEDAVFRFGPRQQDTYTVAEMIASCSLFLRVVRMPDAKLRLRELRKRFRVFKSRNARGAAHFTGYYTPRLRASRALRSPADVPVFGPPRDLVRVDINRFVPDYAGPPIFGRVHEGRLVDYFPQQEILFKNRIPVADALFFLNAADYYHLQLQGGALIDFGEGKGARPDSTPAAVYYEYAADNGRDFKSPGKAYSVPRDTLRRRARKDPRAFQEGLAKNPRYIFFQPQSRGPSGSLKTPLTPGRSLAMDSSLIRGGVPAFVTTASRTHKVHRFAVVQDTGNAIRGHGRVDFYWGDDRTAERRATRFKQDGRVFLFVARK